MSDFESRLSALRSQQREAERAHATAQARLEQIEASVAAETKALKALGFDSVEEAERFVAETDSEISEALARIEKVANGS